MLEVLVLALLQVVLASVLPIINQISFQLEGPKQLDALQTLESRIAYGEPVNMSEYPYFVSLRGCGGSIISEEWVVTAAHCVYPQKRVGKYILTGGDNEYEYNYAKIEDVIIHPLYLYTNVLILNDIALIKLAKPLQFNEYVQPLKLPSENKELDIGDKHVFIGKGADEKGAQSDYLKKMEVTIDRTDVCYSKSFPVINLIMAPFMPWLNETTICSIRVENLPGAGPGDSGSPMVKDDVLVGIASYLTTPFNNRYMFLTNVAHYVSWIHDVIEVYKSVKDLSFSSESEDYSISSSESEECLSSSSESEEYSSSSWDSEEYWISSSESEEYLSSSELMRKIRTRL